MWAEEQDKYFKIIVCLFGKKKLLLKIVYNCWPDRLNLKFNCNLKFIKMNLKPFKTEQFIKMSLKPFETWKEKDFSHLETSF